MPVLVHHPPTETPPRRCSLSVPRPRRCQVQVWHAATGEGSAESLLSLTWNESPCTDSNGGSTGSGSSLPPPSCA